MLITGIIITIVAIALAVFPQFFAKLKSPKATEKLMKSPKYIYMLKAVRIWGLICVGIGIALIIISLN